MWRRCYLLTDFGADLSYLINYLLTYVRVSLTKVDLTLSAGWMPTLRHTPITEATARAHCATHDCMDAFGCFLVSNVVKEEKRKFLQKIILKKIYLDLLACRTAEHDCVVGYMYMIRFVLPMIQFATIIARKNKIVCVCVCVCVFILFGKVNFGSRPTERDCCFDPCSERHTFDHACADDE